MRHTAGERGDRGQVDMYTGVSGYAKTAPSLSVYRSKDELRDIDKGT